MAGAMTMDRTRWGLVALLFIAGIGAALQFIKVSLTLEPLAAAYGQPIQVVAFLVTMVSLMGIVFGVIAGALVARIGTRRAILWALLLGGVLSLIEALMPPFAALVLLRVGEGVSHLALVVAIPPTLARISTDRDRPIAMALWAMFFGVSFVLAAAVLPVLMGWGGLPLIFAGHGALLLGLAAALWRPLPDSTRTAPPLGFIAAHRAIYANLSIAGPGLVFIWYTLMFVASVTFLPGVLGRPELAGTLPLISLAGTLSAGFLGRRYAPRHIAVAGYACMVVGFPLAAMGLLPGAYLAFIGMGLVPGACFAAIPAWNRAPGDQTLSTGAIAQLGNVGTGLGTPLLAFALTLGGTGAVWVVLLLLSLIGLSAPMVLRRNGVG
ncbi:MAG: MFS transporter [Shimia sp.]